MSGRIKLFIAAVAAIVGGLAWLYFAQIDIRDIPFGVWLTAAGIGALIGMVGEATRERDHRSTAEKADQQAAEAREAAEKAMANAEAALKPRWDKLTRKEQEMRDSITRADATRDAADREAAKGRERIEELEQKNARLGSQLNECLEKGERGKKKHDECIAERNQLRDQSADAEATIAFLKNELEDAKYRLHEEEQKRR